MTDTQPITVETTVNASVEKVWQYWNEPEHIKEWAFASDDWHAPYSENDVRTGGKFKTRMEAKGGGEGFDFEGTYTNVKEHELIEYEMSDGRKVKVIFEQTPEGVKVTEIFDPESENPPEFQRVGWQAILENFKKHAEGE